MARAKGSPKLGGRKKGTPNKVTADIKHRIKQFIENEFDDVVVGFGKLEARDKVALFERFLSYAVPKMAQVDITTQVAAEYAELERLLRNAPDDAVTAIVKKIEELKEISKTVKK